MANFNTHLGVAAIGSGMFSTLCLQVGFVNTSDALLLASAGVIGGILPDIDLHYSYPSRILFSLLGIFTSFLWIFSVENELPIAGLWGAGLGIYLLIRYPLWSFFNKFTVHRGSVHSINAALLFSFLAVLISSYLFYKVAFIAWLVGFFVFFGFILHLLLDEFYSVDFMGRRLKRSFGTALKLFDGKKYQTSLFVFSLVLVSYYFTPDIHPFLDTLTSVETYQLILQRMF